VFKLLSKNLYVHKPKNQGSEEQASPEANMLSILNENKSFFTNWQVKRAQEARNLVRALGCPSNADPKKVIRLNMIKDCPVVKEDVVLAKKFFGKDKAVFKGKTTMTRPKPVIHVTIEIPKALKMAQKEVMLCVNTFFVNKMPFIHTISDRIHYRTSQWVPDREAITYWKYLKVVCKVYTKAGFKIRYVCADPEFDSMLNEMAFEYEFIPNIATAQEHVPVVERSIRVVKEWCQATFHGNLFKSLPKVLLKSVMQECTRKLNFFPVVPQYTQQGSSCMRLTSSLSSARCPSCRMYWPMTNQTQPAAHKRGQSMESTCGR
jgi:hypothetical protein